MVAFADKTTMHNMTGVARSFQVCEKEKINKGEAMSCRRYLILILSLCALSTSACNSGPRGTYRDAQGAVVMELRSGGKARFTFSGDVEDCTYTADSDRLTLTCKGDATPTVFTIHDDGSLTGPPGSFMPPLRKEK